MSQHFKILREAGLIRSERRGVELKNSTRCHELKKKYGPMINDYGDSSGLRKRGQRIHALKSAR
jgi:DNA-binding transcriptional ArsR family regulator